MKTSVLLFLMLFLLAADNLFGQERWEAPAEAGGLKNIYSWDDPEPINHGKELYTMLCELCHGERGNGAGMAGQAWNPPPSDFTSEDVQAQSDGVLFWKIREGNPPNMLSYKNLLSEEEVWQLVTYIRQFRPEK